MIRSFGDKDLERFWLSKGAIHVKCVPSELRQITYRKLRELDQAKDSRDLRNTPSNYFEKLAKSIKVNHQVIQELIEEKRDLDKDLATRLALYFDMSTEFWLEIQHDYEQDCIENLRVNLSKEITPLRISK